VLSSVREGDGQAIKIEDLNDPVSRLYKGLRLTFADRKVFVQTEAEPKWKRLNYKLNSAKSPREIDFSPGLTPTNEAIYRVEGNKLILAFSLGWELVSGGTYKEHQYNVGRPRDFKKTEDRAAPVVFILKRVQP